MKVRRIKSGSAAEFYIKTNKLFYIIRGIGALYELCAPFQHFSLLTSNQVHKITNRDTRHHPLPIPQLR